MLEEGLITGLTEALGPSKIVQKTETVERYSADALTPSRAFGAAPLLKMAADLVVKPSSPQDVVAIVNLATKHQTPLVPYGGGTGVMGAVIPVKGGIIVDLRGLNRVLEVNTKDRTATVESGIPQNYQNL